MMLHVIMYDDNVIPKLFRMFRNPKEQLTKYLIQINGDVYLHVNSAIKSNLITTNSKFSLKQVAWAENIIIKDTRNRSEC